LLVVHILVATDASWLVDDIVAALGDESTSFTVCSEGREVSKQVARLDESGGLYDLGIFDLQIGSMGGMAVTMALRLDASLGNAPAIPVLMLLDRIADVHLAKRCGADGWIIKPLDPLRLRRAAERVARGGTYTEGYVEPEVEGSLPVDAVEAPTEPPLDQPLGESAGSEPAPAG
jgi:DNA-binding NarL/FixJ family response regulator